MGWWCVLLLFVCETNAGTINYTTTLLNNKKCADTATGVLDEVKQVSRKDRFLFNFESGVLEKIVEYNYIESGSLD